jgi:integrase
MSEIIPRGERKWLVRVFIKRVNGKKKYHSKMVRGTKKDAEKYARQKETERDLGTLDKPAKEDPEFSDYLDDWMKEFKKGSVKARTLEGYEYTIQQYVKPYFKGVLLSALTARRIQNAYNEMNEAGYSPRTIAFAHSLIREALNQAVVDDLMDSNPSLSTRRPPRKKKPIQVFNPDEASRFIKSAKQDPLGIVFWFALATGMRPEEYLALSWDDLDLENLKVNVHRTIFFPKGGGWVIEEVKTDSSIRKIGFDARLAKGLSAHKREQAQQRMKLGNKYQNNALVFATKKGQPLQLRNLTLRHLVPIIERAKIDGPRNLYRLRHSFVTLSLLWGIDPKTVSRAAGHSSVAFTIDTYQHVLPQVADEAAKKIGKMLFGAV